MVRLLEFNDCGTKIVSSEVLSKFLLYCKSTTNIEMRPEFNLSTSNQYTECLVENQVCGTYINLVSSPLDLLPKLNK